MTTLSPHADATRLAPRHLPASAPRCTDYERRLIAENRELLTQVEAYQRVIASLVPRSINTDLTPNVQAALDLLMSRPVVTKEMLRSVLEARSPTVDGRSDEAIESLISRYLRPFLRRHGVEVRSRRFTGYWIEPEDKVALRRAFAQEEMTS